MDPSALVRRPAYIELKTGLRTALRADAGGCDSRTRDHALPLAFCGTYHCMRIAHCTIQPAFIALSRRRLLTCPQCSSQYLAEWKVMDVEFITELSRHDTFSAACNVAELAKDDFNPLEGGPNHIVEERSMHEWFRAEFFVTFQFQHVSVMHLEAMMKLLSELQRMRIWSFSLLQESFATFQLQHVGVTHLEAMKKLLSEPRGMHICSLNWQRAVMSDSLALSVMLSCVVNCRTKCNN